MHRTQVWPAIWKLGLYLAALVAIPIALSAQGSAPPTSSAPTVTKSCLSAGSYIIQWDAGPSGSNYMLQLGPGGSGSTQNATTNLAIITVPQGATWAAKVVTCTGGQPSFCSAPSAASPNMNWYSIASCFFGGCPQSANSTLVALDGTGFQPVEGCPYQLTRIGSEPDGNRFLLDEWAVMSYPSASESFSEVLVEGSSSDHFGQAQGRCLARGGVSANPRTLARSLGKSLERNSRGEARSSVAVIAHVPHALNERFMPKPTISLRPNALPYTDPPIQALLRIEVGMDETIRAIDTVLSDSAIPEAAIRAIRNSLQIDYTDARRHRMAVYALVRVAQGGVRLEDVLITLPECCPNCPAPPYVCQ